MLALLTLGFPGTCAASLEFVLDLVSVCLFSCRSPSFTSSTFFAEIRSSTGAAPFVGFSDLSLARTCPLLFVSKCKSRSALTALSPPSREDVELVWEGEEEEALGTEIDWCGTGILGRGILGRGMSTVGLGILGRGMLTVGLGISIAWLACVVKIAAQITAGMMTNRELIGMP